VIFCAGLVGNVRLERTRANFCAGLVGNVRLERTRANFCAVWWETYAPSRREIAGEKLRQLLLALHLDGFNRGCGGLRVKVAATYPDRLQVLVQLV